VQGENVFFQDSLKHYKYVQVFVNKLKSEEVKRVFYMSDYNFASNDTYVVWKDGKEIRATLISNKKLKNRIKNKKIRLSNEQTQSLLKMLDNEAVEYRFLNDFSDCKSELVHFYYLGIIIDEQKYILNSKCLPNLRANKSIAPLIELMDYNHDQSMQ